MKKISRLSFLIALVASCATQTKPPFKKETKKSRISSFIKKRGKIEHLKNRKKVETPSAIVKTYCHYFKRKVRPAVLKLSLSRGEMNSPYGLYEEIMKLSSAQCEKLSAREIASLLKPLRALKGKKIALVLPLSGKDKQKGKLFLEGVEALLKGEGKNFDEYFSLFDTKSSFEAAQKVYAQSFLLARHSLVLGGTTQEEALFLNEIASSLHTPVLVFDRVASHLEVSSYFFQILPEVSFQAKALAENCVLRGLEKVALFRPNHGYADLLLEELVRELGRRKIVVEKVLSYDSGDYPSMSEAVASLLPEPEEEIIREEEPPPQSEEQEAEESLVKIIPGELFSLEEENTEEEPSTFPLDGVFIPDNFRILKHFVKLFEYHKVPKVTLFGNEQWRSENLLTLWEEYWNGAFFVDFMGSMERLPLALLEGVSHSTLGHAGEVLAIDAKRIAYYGAKMALQATGTQGVSYRKDLASALKGLKNEDIFEGLRNPSEEGGLSWPQYIFSLQDGEVEVSTSL